MLEGAPSHATADDGGSVPELQRRLVFSLLRPAVRLCRLFRLPLRTLQDLARLAYLEELRRRGGATQAEAADLLGTSLRTVASLDEQYRGDFLAPEREVELARRIEDTLGRGPATAERLAALPGAEAEGVERALVGLVTAGRVEGLGAAGGDPSGYRLRRSFVSLVGDGLLARIDGLNHQLDVIAAAVRSRFLGGDERPALARTLSFVGTSERVSALANELARSVRQRCADAEEDSLGQDGFESYSVTLALAPGDELVNLGREP